MVGFRIERNMIHHTCRRRPKKHNENLKFRTGLKFYAAISILYCCKQINDVTFDLSL